MSAFDGFANIAWMSEGACLSVGSEPFTPTYQGASPKAAKAVCAVCPVLDACRDYALNDASLYGIWGGTTYKERVKMRGEVAA